MESCSSSSFWGRYLLERGFRVAVILAQHVKTFAQYQKNDSNDALAICEAAMRPGIHRVAVKSNRPVSTVCRWSGRLRKMSLT